MLAVRALAALALCACSESHPPSEPYGPCRTPPEECPDGQVCRETLDGRRLCMPTCAGGGWLCENGALCINRIPGPPYVCWPGGPVAAGGACERGVECEFGHTCTWDGICAPSCVQTDPECTIPMLACAGEECPRRGDVGSPCGPHRPCLGDVLCTATTLYTCQRSCFRGACPNPDYCGPEDLDFVCWESGPVAIGGCERTATGSIGCPSNEVCTLTGVGVRRCSRVGCRPDGSGTPCLGHACLADPEDPEGTVCWLGGTNSRGPCTDSYECWTGQVCAPDGVCRNVCEELGAPCETPTPTVCRDYVCMPVEGEP